MPIDLTVSAMHSGEPLLAIERSDDKKKFAQVARRLE